VPSAGSPTADATERPTTSGATASQIKLSKLTDSDETRTWTAIDGNNNNNHDDNHDQPRQPAIIVKRFCEPAAPRRLAESSRAAPRRPSA
jgi:hypothetical protein